MAMYAWHQRPATIPMNNYQKAHALATFASSEPGCRG
jgi:hypothetical protein